MELLEANGFNFLTGDPNDNLVLYSALRMSGYMYEEKKAKLAPKTYFSSKNINEYLENKGPLIKGFLYLNMAIDSFNIFFVTDDLEVDDDLDNEMSAKLRVASIIQAKHYLDSGKASDLRTAISKIKEDADSYKQKRLAEFQNKKASNQDIELRWFEKLEITDSYQGKITLNGGVLDVNSVSKDRESYMIGVGRWGGVVKTCAEDDWHHKILRGSAHGNQEGDVEMKGCLFASHPTFPNPDYTVAADLYFDINRPVEEIAKDFESEVLVDSYESSVYGNSEYLVNSPTIHAMIDLSESEGSQADEIRLEYVLRLKDEGYYDLAGAVLEQIPGDTSVIYNGENVVASTVSIQFDKFVHDQFRDVVVSLANPAQWVFYGAIAKGGAAVLSKFAWGRAVMGASAKFSSFILGASDNAIMQVFLKGFSVVIEEGVEELAGQVHPALEIFMMALTGIDSYDLVNLKTDIKFDYNGDLLSVYEYKGQLDTIKINEIGGAKQIADDVFLIENKEGKVLLYNEGIDISAIDFEDGTILKESEIESQKKVIAVEDSVELAHAQEAFSSKPLAYCARASKCPVFLLGQEVAIWTSATSASIVNVHMQYNEPGVLVKRPKQTTKDSAPVFVNIETIWRSNENFLVKRGYEHVLNIPKGDLVYIGDSSGEAWEVMGVYKHGVVIVDNQGFKFGIDPFELRAMNNLDLSTRQKIFGLKGILSGDGRMDIDITNSLPSQINSEISQIKGLYGPRLSADSKKMFKLKQALEIVHQVDPYIYDEFIAGATSIEYWTEYHHDLIFPQGLSYGEPGGKAAALAEAEVGHIGLFDAAFEYDVYELAGTIVHETEHLSRANSNEWSYHYYGIHDGAVELEESWAFFREFEFYRRLTSKGYTYPKSSGEYWAYSMYRDMRDQYNTIIH